MKPVPPIAASDAAVPHVAGFRRLLQDEPPGFVTRPSLVSGAGMLAGTRTVLDLCLRRHQLVEATELVRRLPEVTFVLDHLGKPRIDQADLRDWADDLARIARETQAVCKLSGLLTEAGPSPEPQAARRWAQHLLDLFGTERVLWGSDWPVLELASSYAAWWAEAQALLTGLHPAARAAVRALFGSIASVHGGGGAASWQNGVAVRGASSSSAIARCAHVSSSLHARHSPPRPSDVACICHRP